jgi:hypothetical protein
MVTPSIDLTYTTRQNTLALAACVLPTHEYPNRSILFTPTLVGLPQPSFRLKVLSCSLSDQQLASTKVPGITQYTE